MQDEEIERIKAEKLAELQAGKASMELEIKVDDGNFQEMVIEQSKKIPIVVDFWAAWCAPCLMLGPTLEKLVKQFNGKFILSKLNVNESPRTSAAYSIMSIPAVKLFKNGEVADQFVGALPEATVLNWLQKNL